jgi:hypothetical protein
MKCVVVEPFTLETASGRMMLPAGRIVELSHKQAVRLASKVKPVTHPNEGRDLPHYCQRGGCWCSSKLPSHLNPTQCRNCQPVDRGREGTT